MSEIPSKAGLKTSLQSLDAKGDENGVDKKGTLLAIAQAIEAMKHKNTQLKTEIEQGFARDPKSLKQFHAGLAMIDTGFADETLTASEVRKIGDMIHLFFTPEEFKELKQLRQDLWRMKNEVYKEERKLQKEIDKHPHSKLVKSLERQKAKGPEQWARFLQKEYSMQGEATDTMTVRQVLATLAQKKDSALSTWESKAFESKKGITNIYELLADANFSGVVEVLPDVEQSKYRNVPLSFGAGTRRLSKDMQLADVDGMIEGSRWVSLMQDAVAMIQVFEGETTANAEKKFIANIAIICGITDAADANTLFTAIKNDPHAVDRFHSFLNGPMAHKAWYYLVYGKDAGNTKFLESHTSKPENNKLFDSLVQDRAQANGIETSVDGDNKTVDTLLSEIATKLNNGITVEGLQKQYQEALKQSSDICYNKTVALLKEKIQQTSDPQKKEAILGELRNIVDNRTVFETSYEQQFGTIFINSIKGASTTVGIANSASMQDMVNLFAKKEFNKKRAQKLQISVGLGYNQFSKGRELLNNNALAKPAITIGLSYGDSKTMGRFTGFYNVGIGGNLIEKNWGVGGSAGVDMLLNPKIFEGEKEQKSWSVAGQNLLSAGAGVDVGYQFGRNGKLLASTFAGLKLDKQGAIDKAKQSIYTQMFAIFNDANRSQSLSSESLGATEKDKAQFDALKNTLGPILDLASNDMTPDDRKKFAEQRAMKCADLWETTQYEGQNGKRHLDQISAPALFLLTTNPTPFSLLVAVASSVSRSRAPVMKESQASITDATDDLATGRGALSFDVDNHRIDGLNALLRIETGKEGLSYGSHTITQEGLNITNTTDYVTIPQSLFGLYSPVLFVDPLIEQFIKKTESGFQVPKELLQVSVYEGVGGQRQVILNMSWKKDLQASKRITKSEDLVVQTLEKDPLTARYETKMEAKYGAIEPLLSKNMLPGEANENQKTMKMLTEKGFTIQKSGEKVRIVEKDGKPYLVLKVQANKNLKIGSGETATYIAKGDSDENTLLDLSNTYLLTEDAAGNFDLQTTSGVADATGSYPFKFSYLGTTVAEYKTSFESKLNPIDSLVYGLMTNSDVIFGGKYDLNTLNQNQNFKNFRKAVDEHQLPNATQALARLFPSITTITRATLDRASVMNIDSALCKITWTRDKSVNQLSEGGTKIDALVVKITDTTLKNNNDFKVLIAAAKNAITNNTSVDDAYMKKLNKFIAGEYGTVKPRLGKTLLDDSKKLTPEYQLAWMLAPLWMVDKQREVVTRAAITKDLNGSFDDVNAYMTMRQSLYTQPEMNKLHMQYPTLNEATRSGSVKNKGIEVVRNGIAMIFGYHDKKSGGGIEAKFVENPMMIAGVSQTMKNNDLLSKKKRTMFLRKHDELKSDLVKSYYESLLGDLQKQDPAIGNTFTLEKFKEMLASGDGKINKDISIDMKWKEGFFPQCVNPTIVLESVGVAKKETPLPHSVHLSLPTCTDPFSNSLNLTSSTLTADPVREKMGVAMTSARLKPEIETRLDAVTETGFTREEIQALDKLLGDGNIQHATNEKFAAWKNLSQEQRDQVLNFLRTKYNTQDRRTVSDAVQMLNDFQGSLVGVTPDQAAALTKLFTGQLSLGQIQAGIRNNTIPQPIGLLFLQRLTQQNKNPEQKTDHPMKVNEFGIEGDETGSSKIGNDSLSVELNVLEGGITTGVVKTESDQVTSLDGFVGPLPLETTPNYIDENGRDRSAFPYNNEQEMLDYMTAGSRSDIDLTDASIQPADLIKQLDNILNSGKKTLLVFSTDPCPACSAQKDLTTGTNRQKTVMGNTPIIHINLGKIADGNKTLQKRKSVLEPYLGNKKIDDITAFPTNIVVRKDIGPGVTPTINTLGFKLGAISNTLERNTLLGRKTPIKK